MRVNFEADPTVDFEDIVGDGEFVQLIALMSGSRTGRVVIAEILRAYKSSSFTDAAMTKTIKFYAAKHPSSPADIDRVCADLPRLLTNLYARYDPGRVRGATLERFVFESIRSRYEQHDHADNVFVSLETGYRTPRSVDAAGWDGSLGECHDCKSRSDKFDFDFSRSMQDNLPPEHFKIGLVCLASGTRLANDLKTAGFQPAGHTSIISLERLWDLAPLQKAA